MRTITAEYGTKNNKRNCSNSFQVDTHTQMIIYDDITRYVSGFKIDLEFVLLDDSKKMLSV